MGGRKALERLYLTPVWKPLPLVCLCMYHSHGDHVLSRSAWVTAVNCNVCLEKYLIFILDTICAVAIAMDNKGRFSDDQLMDCLKKQTEKNGIFWSKKKKKDKVWSREELWQRQNKHTVGLESSAVFTGSPFLPSAPWSPSYLVGRAASMETVVDSVPALLSGFGGEAQWQQMASPEETCVWAFISFTHFPWCACCLFSCGSCSCQLPKTLFLNSAFQA